MSIVLRRDRRSLRIESLEDRAMMSGTSLAAAVATTTTSAGDIVVPIHAQIGSSALEVVLGVAETIDTLETALTSYLNAVPGWHLTGGVDTTPEYSAMIDGSLVIGINGVLKSANVTLTASADIGGAIEGYYGVSVLHVGVGAAIDLSANVSAVASYSIDTNSWYFGGSASLVGEVKGYASAMAWPLKGEIYIAGDLTAGAGVDSDSGIASASVTVVGTIGADAQMKSLFGGWKTIASVSRSLGSLEYAVEFDVGSWLKSQINSTATTTQAARVAAIATTSAANAATAAASSDVATLAAVSNAIAATVETASDTDTITLVAEATVAASTSGTSQQLASNSLTTTKSVVKADSASSRSAALANAAAIEQLSLAGPLMYWAA
jgi:hypothetical protein